MKSVLFFVFPPLNVHMFLCYVMSDSGGAERNQVPGADVHKYVQHSQLHSECRADAPSTPRGLKVNVWQVGRNTTIEILLVLPLRFEGRGDGTAAMSRS